MRTFDERLAEIDRRSKQIKNKRKQHRKAVLAVCVPLLLCASLSIAFLPQTKPPGASALEEMQETVPAMLFLSLGSVYQIDISGQEVSHSITDPAEIEKITDHLLQCGIVTVKTYSAAGSIQDADPSGSVTRGEGIPGSVQDATSCCYTILLSISGEDPVRLSLLDNTLTDLVSGEQYSLSQSQSDALYQLLGLQP